MFVCQENCIASAFFFSYALFIGLFHSKQTKYCISQNTGLMLQPQINPEISVARYVSVFLTCTPWPTQVDGV